jgi:hypothetical protein
MTELIKYDAACRALAEARAVDEVKDIVDKAEAMRVYFRQAKNPQLEADAWEIKKRAEDRFGELSAALDKSEGASAKGTDRGRRLPADGKASKSTILRDVGISTSAAHRYEQFHRLPADEKEARIAKGRAAIEAGKSIADSIISGDDKLARRAEREADWETVADVDDQIIDHVCKTRLVYAECMNNPNWTVGQALASVHYKIEFGGKLPAFRCGA